MTADQKAMETISRAVAIDMPALITAVANREPLNEAFAQQYIFGASNQLLAVTGGALEVLHDEYLMLVFGHRFDGLYFVGGSNVTQTYTQCVRAFRFEVADNQLNVQLVAQQPENPFLQPVDGPYHRRDLSVEPTLVLKDGVPSVQIAAYGGVFKGGLFEGYLNPIYVDITSPGLHKPPEISLNADQATVQLLSQYECAAISSFSLKQQTMYTTFFGGISQYYWDGQSLKRDKPDLSAKPPIDGLPFINSISTLKRGPEGSAQYLHVAQQFPPKPFEGGTSPTLMTCLGAQTIFVPAHGVPNKHDVLLLDELAKPTVIGYLFGGIAAEKGYPTQSCASPKLYQVTLRPDAATDSLKLVKPD